MYRTLPLAFGLFLLLISSVSAAIPQQISYQGKVSGPGNWTDTTVSMTFNVYSDSNGVGSLWSETQSGIAIKGGLFSVQLGRLTPIPNTVFNGAIRWLGVRIGSGSEMRPLTRIVSQPNAYHALNADTATTVPDNAITSAKIANATIQLGDIGQNGATAGKIIKWNGSAWALANDSVVAGGNVSGFTDNGTQVNLTNSGDTVSLGSVSPKGKLHVQGDLSVSANSSLKFGNDTTKLDDYLGTLTMSTKDDISLRPTNDLYISKPGGISWIKFEGATDRVGIGTLSMDDKLHVENTDAGGISFLRLQTSHTTSFGEAGLRIQTPENTWHWRMDDYTHNNLPNAGSLALRSGDAGSEVMTWLEDGKVGIGTTAPNQKLHVYGNARVKDTLIATTVSGNFIGTYKNNSIDTADIKDEPGIASRYSGGKGLGIASTVIDSATITVPAAGYVFAVASGFLNSDHTFGDFINVTVGVNDSATHPSNHQHWHIPYNLVSGSYSVPFSCQGIFRVTAAGTYTYYSVGRNLVNDPSDADAVDVWYHTLTLLYFPTSYGTVEISPAPPLGETNDELHITALNQSRLQQATAHETVKPDLATLESRLNALLQEASALKATISDLKKE